VDFRLGSELTIYTVDQLGDEVISFPSKKLTVPASHIVIVMRRPAWTIAVLHPLGLEGR